MMDTQIRTLDESALFTSSDVQHEHDITAQQLPVGAVVGRCYVAVDLQSGLVVHVRQPVTLQSFISRSAS